MLICKLKFQNWAETLLTVDILSIDLREKWIVSDSWSKLLFTVTLELHGQTSAVCYLFYILIIPT